MQTRMIVSGPLTVVVPVIHGIPLPYTWDQDRWGAHVMDCPQCATHCAQPPGLAEPVAPCADGFTMLAELDHSIAQQRAESVYN